MGLISGYQIGGRWNTNEAMYDINILELKAAFFALKSFCSQANETHVQKQQPCHILTTWEDPNPLHLWEWCIHRNIWVSAVQIAGKLNVGADFKSRSFSDKHEWVLNRNVLTEILSEFPELNMDLFASRLTTQLTQYCSWQPDPGSAFVDAFYIDWSEFNFYAFPTFSLIPRCLQKIQQDKGKDILIIPVWPTQTWFPLVLQLLYSKPWVCQPSPKLLQHITQQTAPTTPETPLNGMSAIRNSSRQYNVSKEVLEVLMASWRLGTKKQHSAYLNKWLEFCSKRTIDYCPPRVSEAVEFLMTLHSQGLSYSSINTARSALSSILKLDNCDNFGTHPLVTRFMKGIYELIKPKPKYNQICDVSRVLDYHKTLYPLEKLSLMELTQKNSHVTSVSNWPTKAIHPPTIIKWNTIDIPDFLSVTR